MAHDDRYNGLVLGKYVVEGSSVTFYWKRGCFGDWKMKPTVSGDTITWSDAEALAPHASDEDKKITEVFNGVPWTRAEEQRVVRSHRNAEVERDPHGLGFRLEHPQQAKRLGAPPRRCALPKAGEGVLARRRWA